MNNAIHEIQVEKLRKDRKRFELILDVFHVVNMHELNSISENSISKYKNSAFTFREIKRELDYSYKLLCEGKCLMAVSLLRNAFEDLMYFFATSIDSSVKVNPYTTAGNLRNIVKSNTGQCFDNMFISDDLEDIYSHLSKVVHVTSIKECINYLDSKSTYRAYMATEFKYETILIECMLMQFLDKRGKYRNALQQDTLFIASTISMINAICFTMVFKHKHNKKINGFFYDAASRGYLQARSQSIADDMQYLKNENARLAKGVESSFERLKEKYLQLGYENTIDEIKLNK